MSTPLKIQMKKIEVKSGLVNDDTARILRAALMYRQKISPVITNHNNICAIEFITENHSIIEVTESIIISTHKAGKRQTTEQFSLNQAPTPYDKSDGYPSGHSERRALAMLINKAINRKMPPFDKFTEEDYIKSIDNSHSEFGPIKGQITVVSRQDHIKYYTQKSKPKSPLSARDFAVFKGALSKVRTIIYTEREPCDDRADSDRHAGAHCSAFIKEVFNGLNCTVYYTTKMGKAQRMLSELEKQNEDGYGVINAESKSIMEDIEKDFEQYLTGLNPKDRESRLAILKASAIARAGEQPQNAPSASASAASAPLSASAAAEAARIAHSAELNANANKPPNNPSNGSYSQRPAKPNKFVPNLNQANLTKRKATINTSTLAAAAAAAAAAVPLSASAPAHPLAHASVQAGSKPLSTVEVRDIEQETNGDVDMHDASPNSVIAGGGGSKPISAAAAPPSASAAAEAARVAHSAELKTNADKPPNNLSNGSYSQRPAKPNKFVPNLNQANLIKRKIADKPTNGGSGTYLLPPAKRKLSSGPTQGTPAFAVAEAARMARSAELKTSLDIPSSQSASLAKAMDGLDSLAANSGSGPAGLAALSTMHHATKPVSPDKHKVSATQSAEASDDKSQPKKPKLT